MIEHNGKTYSSRIEVTLDYLGGKWKTVILYFLAGRTMRFNELERNINGISHKMLAQQLRELERDGLIVRAVFAEVPPRVEYALSDLGGSLVPVLNAMCRWAGEQLGMADSGQ